MKKFFTPLIIFILMSFSYSLIGQSVPQGMKYQAVARDQKGNVLSDRQLMLQISLYSNAEKRIVAYSEVHQITTNSLGLFTLSVGDGKVTSGLFEKIPWSTEEIWMEVAIQADLSDEFVTISDSKMLSVPYAFHAATASELVDQPGKGRGQGTADSTIFWTIVGNKNINPIYHKLGTVNRVDLVVITSDIERMRILATGDINIIQNLTIGQNLGVGQNLNVANDVLLNAIGGKTDILGNLKVDNMSSTYLTGLLNVDKNTTLLGDLDAYGFAKFGNPYQSTSPSNGAVVVAGGQGIIGNLNVGGNYELQGNATLHGLIYNTNTTQSTSKDDGAVVLEGGIGIEKNLNVGGASTFAGPVSFGSAVIITDLTQSTSPTTGALIVAGGAGINKRLNVHEGVLFDSTLGVAGITNITNTTQSTNSTNGALIVAGGTGITKDLRVGGNSEITGRLGIGGSYSNVKLSILSPNSIDFPLSAEVTGTSNLLSFSKSGQLYVKNTTSGASSSTGAFGLFLDAQDQGMVVRLNGAAHPSSSNNYISFWGSGNVVRGAVEGQTLEELHNSFDYIWFQAMNAVDAALGVAITIVDLIGVDDFDAAIVDGIELVAGVAEWIKASVELEDNIGIAFTSGSADYAEWLQKENPAEDYSFGDVVAVRGGKISKNTDDADHYMTISMAPIVLGNIPPKGEEADYEKVAFMGQVPVKVAGVVAIGDYIVPSGNHDGLAIAVPKSNITLQQIKEVIGVAWSENYSKIGYSLINVAIGISANPVIDKLEQQELVISRLQSSINAIGNYLASKDPNFQMSSTTPGQDTEGDLQSVKDFTPSTDITSVASDIENQHSNMTSNRYDDIKATLLENPEQVIEILADARGILDERGVNYHLYPKLERLLNDPVFFIQSLGADPSSFRD